MCHVRVVVTSNMSSRRASYPGEVGSAVVAFNCQVYVAACTLVLAHEALYVQAMIE